MRRFVVLFIVFALAVARADEKVLWRGELASFNSITAQSGNFAKLFGNALFPVLMTTMAQQLLAYGYGPMRTADPIRWVAFEDGEGKSDKVELVMVYPSVEKEGRMTLSHPGAERIRSEVGTVKLPKREGRPYEMYAVFNDAKTYCAFASTVARARKALSLSFPSSDGKLCAFATGSAYASFAVEDGVGKIKVDSLDDKELSRFGEIPLIGSFMKKTGEYKLNKEDIQRLVFEVGKTVSKKKEDKQTNLE